MVLSDDWLEVPKRYRTRAGYACALAVMALVAVASVSLIAAFIEVVTKPYSILPWLEGELPGFLKVMGLGAAASGLAAFLCWPGRGPRTRKRMIVAGLAVVACTFAVLGAVEIAPRHASSWTEWVSITTQVALLGPLMMLGLPFPVAVAVSIAFADPASP